MTVSSMLSTMKACRVISLDPASHSLAWAVLDMNKKGITIVDCGKIDYSLIPEISNKFSKIKKEMP